MKLRLDILQNMPSFKFPKGIVNYITLVVFPF